MWNFIYKCEVEKLTTDPPSVSIWTVLANYDYYYLRNEERNALYIIKNHRNIKKQSYLFYIIHSAGVGRTGTLIATDILIQAANAGKNIDVYSTVEELRKQRMNMVQTEVRTQHNCNYFI